MAFRLGDDYLFRQLIYLQQKGERESDTASASAARGIELSLPKGQLQFVHVKFDRLADEADSSVSRTVLSSREAQLSLLDKGKTLAEENPRTTRYLLSIWTIDSSTGRKHTSNTHTHTFPRIPLGESAVDFSPSTRIQSTAICLRNFYHFVR